MVSGARPAPATAVETARRQREISVSEFFLKNRHLLGSDTPAKALVTAVREAVDNALDACEEAGILPDITVQVSDRSGKSRVIVEDNGPGIVENQIARIFGKPLYGSKFHKLSQSRGQQGMGISAAGMYGQLTVGKPLHIVSRVDAGASRRHGLQQRFGVSVGSVAEGRNSNASSNSSAARRLFRRGEDTATPIGRINRFRLPTQRTLSQLLT
jgi:hypothetical protein